MLAAILRVAEALERSHAQVISGIEVRDRGEDVLLLVHTSDDAELEIWATERHLEPFERLLGRPVRLEVAVKKATGAKSASAARFRARRSGSAAPAPGRTSRSVHRLPRR